MPLISVIVPVYKVEPYLNECVDSILAQTFSDFELILVDDGSPDNCPAICDEYAKKDTRIIVIHKENGGLSSARNAGLDIVKGKYISFVDSDDYLCEFFLELLYNEIIKTGSDFVACNFTKVSDDKSVIETNSDADDFTVFNSKYYEKPYNSSIFMVAWNKLYNSYLFSDIRYPVGKTHEDEYVIDQLVFKSEKISYIQTPLYFYRQRSDSIMHKESYERRILSMLEIYCNRTLFFMSNDINNMFNKYYYDAFDLLFHNYIKMHKNNLYSQVFKTMKRIYKRRKRSMTESLFFKFPKLCIILKGAYRATY